MNFEKLGLLPELIKAIKNRGYKKPTPIQEKAIPGILEGKDILGGAQTGTGKTGAFALPILNKLNCTTPKNRIPRALVITPTRELADQVTESFVSYGQYLPLKTVKIFGGVKMNPQIASLKSETDIVIATPGRLIDHITQKTINLNNIEILVLDEADKMLDMGFIKDIKKIISILPSKRQNLLFSATYGNDIKKLAKDILNNPLTVEVSRRNKAAEKVNQGIYLIDKSQKRHLLKHLIERENWYQVLVFVRTKHGANRLAKSLDKEGIPSKAIHGDRTQAQRTKALNEFKSGDLQALIATDVAARGIHLDNLNNVVNYDLPQVSEDYIHRIGRTGRAGNSGLAISLICNDDLPQLKKIEKLLKTDLVEFEAFGFVPVKIPKTVSKKANSEKPVGNKPGRRFSKKTNSNKRSSKPKNKRK